MKRYTNGAKNVNKDSLIKERSVNRINALKTAKTKTFQHKSKNSSKVPTGIFLVKEALTHSIVKVIFAGLSLFTEDY